MFRCAITGKVTQPGEPMNRVVTQTRKVTYREKRDGELVVVGKGTEIVKEIAVSAEGLAILKAQEATK